MGVEEDRIRAREWYRLSALFLLFGRVFHGEGRLGLGEKNEKYLTLHIHFGRIVRFLDRNWTFTNHGGKLVILRKK